MWAQPLLCGRWRHRHCLYQLLPSHVSLLRELSQTPSLLLARAFESPPWTTVYLQATVMFNFSTAITSPLYSRIHFMASNKPFFYSIVLCAKLSHFSSPPTPPSWFFHSRSDPRTWAGGCVVWTLLNESLWTSYHRSQCTAYEYAYAQWLLTNYKARLQCQSAAAAEPDSSLHL